MEKENLNIDTQQVMTYFRQGIAGETSVLPSISEVEGAEGLSLDDRVHNLTDFLKRPFDVLKAEWSKNSIAGTELIPTGISLPDVFFKNHMVREKLRGFLGLKGTIRAKIMINAQKFQQGALMLYWIPNYDNIKVKANMVQQSLAGKSGCGHIVINCEGGTEQTIDIPYVNQHIYYNMATNQGNYGRLFLTPLLQLAATDTATVGIRIQMWMENPQPVFATSAVPVLSQSTSQIEEKAKHPSDSEPLTKGGGLDVGAVIGAVKQASLKPSYLSRTAANVLELVGLSKPSQTCSIHRTSLRTNSYMANYNGEFMGHKMALAADNELAAMAAPAGTTADEMLISTLVKAPTYYKTFTVKTRQANGQYGENFIVFSDLVHPLKFVPSSNQPGGVLDSTFIGYTASAFGQWRGGIKYNFTVAKTCFHSGTLRVSFLPGIYDAAPGIPNSTDPEKSDYAPQFQLERCYQQTYDLRELTEFSFVVPYASTRPYLACVNPYGSAAATIAKQNWASGMLVVDVFIPLVAPAAISQSLEIAVWISGADDLTFANPTAPSIYPYSPVPVGSQSFSMDEGTDRAAAIYSTDGNMNRSTPKTELTASALCTGEVILSISALMRRFGPFYDPGIAPANSAIIAAPFDFKDPIAAAAQLVLFDYIDYFSYLYAFYRGGMRLSLDPGNSDSRYVNTWRILMRTALNNFYPEEVIPRAQVVAPNTIPPQLLASPFANAISKPSIEGIIDVEIPYYNLTHITPVLTANQTANQVEESNYPTPLVTFMPRNGVETPNPLVKPVLFRAASDDFRFMYMLGPPQVALLADSSNVLPIQDEPVKYTTTTIVNNGSGNFKGAFGLTNFIVPSTTPGVAYKSATQFIATNAEGDRIWLLPRNLVYRYYNDPAVNNQLNIDASYWTGGSTLRMLTGVPNFTFEQTNLKPSMYVAFDVIAPASGVSPQAAPVPCLTVKSAEAIISANLKTITIPNQGVITFEQPFTLKARLLVFRSTDEETPTFLNATLLDADASVEFRLETPDESETARYLSVINFNDVLIGYIPINLTGNVGYPPNKSVPTLTEAEAYKSQ